MGFIAKIALLALCFGPSLAQSTVFIPLALEVQLDTTDGALHGIYRGKRGSKKISSGLIVTEHSLSIIAASGIEPQDILNGADQRFLTLGGEVAGLGQIHEGAAQFREGEEVVLLLKETSDGFLMNNRALGKYRVEKRQGKKVLINSIYPDEEGVSNISLEEFNNLVEARFGTPLREVDDRQVHKTIEKKKPLMKKGIISERKTASFGKNTERKEGRKGTIVIWPLFALIFLLGLYFFLRRKRGL